MQIRDFTAHIIVDDEELEEYHVELETPRRATCWIASEAGKTFGIRWRRHAKKRTAGNVGWVTIDGICCDGLPMHPGRVGDGDTKEMHDVNISETTTRDFIFSPVRLSDEDHLLHNKVPDGFGEIRLVIQHGKLVKDGDDGDDDEHMRVLDGNDRFHESSGKAAHHRVAFGQERAQDCDLSVFTLDPNGKPSFFFVFKYRPIEILRADGLVPGPGTSDKSPSPKPDPEPVPDRSQTRSKSNGRHRHRARLQKQIQDHQNKIKKLQALADRLSEEPRPRKRIKREHPGLNKQSRSVTEVIDLTED